MSNYTKSYNFRNGVQVDDDNFVVTSTGLVGIGTTTPNEHLDVRGNIKVVGDARITGYTSVTNIEVVGVMTVGAGITLDPSSGIITATKFVGDASALTNIVAIATDGFIANVGSLTTTAKIGIGNLSPTNQLDVSGNSKFVGVTTFAGITTVTGETLFTKQLNVSGVSTFTGAIDANGNLDVNGTIISSGDITISNDNPTLTFTEGDGDPDYRIIGNVGKLAIQDIQDSFAERFVVNAGGIIEVQKDLDIGRDLKVTGVSTFTDDIFVGTGATVGFGTTAYFPDNAKAVFGDSEDLSIFHDGTRSVISDQGEGNIIVLASAVNFKNAADNNQRLAILPNGVQAYSANVKKFETIGTGASVYNELRVASLHGGTSGLSPHFGSLRYGHELAGSAPYSTRKSLDLINTDSGNINFYLNANNLSDATAGDFHWHKAFNNAQLMTLTNTGLLGIGETQPNTTLHVQGISTVTGKSFVGGIFYAKSNVVIDGNTDIGGNLSVDGSFSLSSTLNANVSGNVTGKLIGNVLANSGVSTFNSVAIATDFPAGGIGLDGSEIMASFGSVGIGTTILNSGADFANCGETINDRYMIPPTITTAERNGIGETANGGLIFNSTLKRLEVYIDNGWVGIATTT